MYYNGLVNLMLENLNPEQKLAVETTDGPLLVLSGAGTGKTRVLTTRVAYILNNALALPWQVLALTFTNKAANEMKTRLATFSDGASWYASDVWCGTFHSICLRILRANADAAGMRRDFIIYGEDDQKRILKNVFAEMGLDIKDFSPSDWVERISSIKDKGLHSTEHTSDTALKILNAYNAELARLGAVDFGDIILRVLQLFDAFPDILARYQRQFKYILVDEFQDTNAAQMQFLQMLTRGIENPNICCVGDDDQSIYSWRGAEIKNILNFERTFPNAQIIRLETNYRSTPNILGAANSLIRHNTGRLGKDLHTAPNAPAGEPVYVLTVPSDFDEARLVSDIIMRKSDDESYSNYAVLIRAGSLSRLFEEEFTARGIPYKLIGATKFYDREEIKDVIAYLRLLVYPFDDMAFLRIIGKPRRGFGPSAIAKLRAAGANLMDGLCKASLTGKQRAAADAFLSAFDFDWQSVPPTDAAQKLLDNAGYIQMWRESRDADAADRLDNIRELITNVIAKYDTLPPVEHLVYASSSSVYGTNQKVPYSTEDKVDNPVSLYAATKKSNELMAHAYSKLYNIPSTGLRFFTVYGPAGRPDMAYFSFTNKLLKGDTIQIFNFGNCKRDFTYIDDIVEGVMRVMQGAPEKKNGADGLPIPPYAVYNIGNQNPENLLDFVDILQQELIAAGVLPETYDFEAHKQLVPMQPGDVPVTYADTSALERDFGFKPTTPLREGLRKFARWYQEFYTA